MSRGQAIATGAYVISVCLGLPMLALWVLA